MFKYYSDVHNYEKENTLIPVNGSFVFEKQQAVSGIGAWLKW
jgi:hypothetical protein